MPHDEPVEPDTPVGRRPPSDEVDERDRLVAEVARQQRLTARQLLRFYHAAADRLGLPVTDLACLGALRDRGHASVSDLAVELGLTTGAVSRMVDRLEQAGYVRRRRDPADARRVIVELITPAPIVGLFAELAADTVEYTADLSTDRLRLLLDYLRHQEDSARRAADRLRR